MKPCPVCDAPLSPWICRPQTPVFQNLPFLDAASARAVPRGDLDLWSCAACGFASNVAFDAAKLTYDTNYENAQDCSPAFDAYLDARVEALIAAGVARKRVVEVGCGQGQFLRRLCARGENVGHGFDPACRQQDSGALHFHRGLFGAEQRTLDAEVVVCRHVIEHVPSPRLLLRSICDGVAPGTRVFLETPDLAWILAGQVFWDLFYEHCSLFSRHALVEACRRERLEVRSVERLFGGQYLWVEAVVGGDVGGVAQESVDFAAYAQAERALVQGWTRRIAALPGKVAVWGAGAKGATFAALLDPDATRIDCVVDINPAKQGRFLPGTAHPIVGPDALAARGVRHAIVMNPNYLAEIAALAGPAVSLLPAQEAP